VRLFCSIATESRFGWHVDQTNETFECFSKHSRLTTDLTIYRQHPRRLLYQHRILVTPSESDQKQHDTKTLLKRAARSWDGPTRALRRQ
jgi:hypothetical protein